mmetsp:Transcript_10190/g.62113  ORF Transcript_10190/g.62113 Transcript_10190/m.62113 type:complete len:239 (-) Transcript_10190:63-779(-)
MFTFTAKISNGWMCVSRITTLMACTGMPSHAMVIPFPSPLLCVCLEHRLSVFGWGVSAACGVLLFSSVTRLGFIRMGCTVFPLYLSLGSLYPGSRSSMDCFSCNRSMAACISSVWNSLRFAACFTTSMCTTQSATLHRFPALSTSSRSTDIRMGIRIRFTSARSPLVALSTPSQSSTSGTDSCAATLRKTFPPVFRSRIFTTKAGSGTAISTSLADARPIPPASSFSPSAFVPFRKET